MYNTVYDTTYNDRLDLSYRLYYDERLIWTIKTSSVSIVHWKYTNFLISSKNQYCSIYYIILIFSDWYSSNRN